MDLASEYKRQYAWRAWSSAYDGLPGLSGASVLDLGCAIGDQAKDLAARGARVVGIDGNADLVANALSRRIPGARFLVGDVRSPPVEGGFDGIWASFVCAYFPDLGPVLASWRELLRPGGWIALVEVDGLFAHEPLGSQCKAFLERYADEALQAGRYDFGMGGKLAVQMEQAGLRIECHRVLQDAELSFNGPAAPEVMRAWTERLDRMRLLVRRAEVEWPSFRSEFLACLASEFHVSRCQVHFCLARRD